MEEYGRHRDVVVFGGATEVVEETGDGEKVESAETTFLGDVSNEEYIVR